jgi:hypothetical protein
MVHTPGALGEGSRSSDTANSPSFVSKQFRPVKLEDTEREYKDLGAVRDVAITRIIEVIIFLEIIHFDIIEKVCRRVEAH